MNDNYAEKTGNNTFAIHASRPVSFRIYEAICRSIVEYPDPCPENWQEEKRELKKLKIELEELLYAKTDE